MAEDKKEKVVSKVHTNCQIKEILASGTKGLKVVSKAHAILAEDKKD